MTVSIAVAIGANGVIGAMGQMPWPPTGDQRQFKELTWGHPLVMGRTTYESIGRPLPGRTSIVLTRNRQWDSGHGEVLVAGTLDEAIALAYRRDDQVFLIGGATVYAEALDADLVDRMVVTEVPLSPVGDAYFGPIDPRRWSETSRVGYRGTPDYEVVTFERSRT
ncbi:dihydrofolate reductase [Mycobacterium sp.]|uniref:dihydrofolate reductase n=1 Tax=Mycobacterium sp. TaxID=1785 RepID=UPI003A89146A